MVMPSEKKYADWAKDSPYIMALSVRVIFGAPAVTK
ncbi:hypothetical protein WGH24286_01977 [Periweissella ghanensis]|uniref:Uncharacterized protein n=1 Tax=Periweissella ghanensis TaxID=467997 RepID=A0ABN8BRE1_9LACO|nr:hypothetical protein WGH24286_01977 [Periweissella ghanensis]